MKKLILTGTILLLTINVLAQNFTVQPLFQDKDFGGGVKSYVAHTDATGIYLFSANSKLVKTSHSGKILFEKKIPDILGNLEIVDLRYFGEQLIIFAKDYDKKGNSFSFYGIRINLTTGNPEGGLKLISKLAIYPGKNYDFTAKVLPSPFLNETVILVDKSAGTSGSSFSLILVGKELENSKVVNIELPYHNYSGLDSIKITKSRNIIAYGYYTFIKNKTRSRQFYAHQFDLSGKKVFDLQTNIDNKYLHTGRIIEKESGEVFIGGLYKIDSLQEDAEGICLLKYDPNTGKVVSADFKEVTRKSFGFHGTNKKNENDRVIHTYSINDFFYSDKEQSFFFICEESWETESYGKLKSASGNRTLDRNNHLFFRNSLVFIKMKEGNSAGGWIVGLPKAQTEMLNGTGDYSSYISYLAANNRYPLFSSCKYFITNNKLILFMNDNNENSLVTSPDAKFESVSQFKKSVLYAIVLDLNSGKYLRKEIYSNKSDPKVLMPRHATIKNNEVFIPGQKTSLLNSAAFRIVKVTVD